MNFPQQRNILSKDFFQVFGGVICEGQKEDKKCHNEMPWNISSASRI
ncbi:unnamed protein product [Larinioides sclopetarius]|uniref:Uncharacterized protein n=1 Tax=Larinioides sclopetarius TaxID=280406 RepID=A0AAV1YVB2_9ARAC